MNWVIPLLRRLQKQQWMSYPLITGMAASAVGLLIFSIGAWEPLERLAYNKLLQLRAYFYPTEWADEIVVIAIDEESLDAYGRFPWKRDRYAAFLDVLLASQPAAVGFDIVLTEATPYDATFADSIVYSGNVVLAVGDDGTGQVLDISPTISDPAHGAFLLGHTKNNPDPDGISRQVWLYEGEFPSLGIALLQMYQTSLENTLGTEVPDISAIQLPQPGEQDTYWLNWVGPIQPNESQTTGLSVISFVDVLEGNIDPSGLQNKIVLVGVTAAALDPLRTPFHVQIPTAGVFLHAAVVDNLIHDRFLQRAPLRLTAFLIGVAGVSTAWLLQHLNSRQRIFFLLGIVPVSLAIALLGLSQNLLLPIAAPLGTSFISALSFQFVEQRERNTLMNLLALNASPEMARLMWQNKNELLQDGQIQPQELTATVLFCDIRGFTSIAETLPSEVMLPWLNRYFEVMTNCIMAQGGVVDKYIGDAIMAAFGVPLAMNKPEQIQQNAIAAIRAALDMHHHLQTLNREFEAAGLPTIRFGIGVHTGPLIVGTVGSRKRLSYSLFGDTVNIAARLQDMTKTLPPDLPLPCLFSEETHAYLGDGFLSKPMGNIQLRGRITEIPIYTLLDSDDPDNFSKTLESSSVNPETKALMKSNMI
ncbi:MAG: adenylate/guanylate cyclase domain-containing protein [Cyanobacteria bacterium J06638_22]